VLDHRSLPPVFVSQRGHIWRVFHLRLRFITIGGRSVHLAYRVHKSGHKTPIIINLRMILAVYLKSITVSMPSTSNGNTVYSLAPKAELPNVFVDVLVWTFEECLMLVYLDEMFYWFHGCRFNNVYSYSSRAMCWCSFTMSFYQSLSHCELVTDEGIRHLGVSTCATETLQVLELDNCPLITDASLEFLQVNIIFCCNVKVTFIGEIIPYRLVYWPHFWYLEIAIKSGCGLYTGQTKREGNIWLNLGGNTIILFYNINYEYMNIKQIN